MTLHQPPPMPTHQLNLEDESNLHLLSVFHFTLIVLSRTTVKMTYAANTRV